MEFSIKRCGTVHLEMGVENSRMNFVWKFASKTPIFPLDLIYPNLFWSGDELILDSENELHLFWGCT